ncbi:E3 ubiquitin-protein ligase Os04g0590900-like [Miscanthus floridulus]|uniref:E3 ubiquitin-protein ligase Os04g0590900-like n=1 Tax=Miscanthus floridulus TaxID=154761 RepID=UPI0034597BE7
MTRQGTWCCSSSPSSSPSTFAAISATNSAAARSRSRPPAGKAPRSRPQQQQRPAVAAAPPAVDVELAQEPVLECTFRTADGWEQTLCSVCQSEMADGEKVRVLTACTHSFHTTCVEQWLREHATCPLCRAPTSATAAKGRQHRPTT